MTQRQPKGTPVGGQFAASAHDEASSSLSAPVSSREIADRLLDPNGGPDALLRDFPDSRKDDMRRAIDVALSLDEDYPPKFIAEWMTDPASNEKAVLRDLPSTYRADAQAGIIAAVNESRGNAEVTLRHNAAIREIADIVKAKYPLAEGVSFDPAEDELDRELGEDDFEEVWVDAGPRKRVPIAHFGEDPEDSVEFDAVEDAEIIQKLTDLSENLDRNRLGFTAIGEYEIEAYF